MNPFKVTAHAVKMVGRNKRSYALLSVTIVLSFTLLLGYLCFVDSQHYNRYKQTFSFDRGRVSAVIKSDPALDGLISKRLNELDGTSFQLLYQASGAILTFADCTLETGEKVVLPYDTTIWSIPSHAAEFYTADPEWTDWLPTEINWIDGKEHEGIHLEPDEIIVDENLYRAFELDKKDYFAPAFSTFSGDNKGMPNGVRFRVVGTIPSIGEMELDFGTSEGFAYVVGSYVPEMLFSGETLNPSSCPNLFWWSNFMIYSDQPELVKQMINSLVQGTDPAISVYEAQDRANQIMKTENRTKALICGAMLIILGINLYSCFANALNERRFEIGVKRALGASAWSIVRQFLYESLCVMAVNILVSVALVADIFIVYKFIYERTPNEYGQYFQWTIYISPHSIAMFAVCTITLTVVFSLIFAYKSTQVRIADQLKAE